MTTKKSQTGKSVFVPFEAFPGRAVTLKVDDLPRFDRIEDVKTYMLTIGADRIRGRLISWDEITEKWARDEFETGLGTLRILL